jgi:glutaredoxin
MTANADLQSMVQGMIKENKVHSRLPCSQPSPACDGSSRNWQVMVFSKSTCPFCLKAKKHLDSFGAQYEVCHFSPPPTDCCASTGGATLLCTFTAAPLFFSAFSCASRVRMLNVGAFFGQVIELNQREDGQDIQDIMLGMTGARSVPRVFIGGLARTHNP